MIPSLAIVLSFRHHRTPKNGRNPLVDLRSIAWVLLIITSGFIPSIDEQSIGLFGCCHPLGFLGSSPRIGIHKGICRVCVVQIIGNDPKVVWQIVVCNICGKVIICTDKRFAKWGTAPFADHIEWRVSLVI